MIQRPFNILTSILLWLDIAFWKKYSSNNGSLFFRVVIETLQRPKHLSMTGVTVDDIVIYRVYVQRYGRVDSKEVVSHQIEEGCLWRTRSSPLFKYYLLGFTAK